MIKLINNKYKNPKYSKIMIVMNYKGGKESYQ